MENTKIEIKTLEEIMPALINWYGQLKDEKFDEESYKNSKRYQHIMYEFQKSAFELTQWVEGDK